MFFSFEIPRIHATCKRRRLIIHEFELVDGVAVEGHPHLGAASLPERRWPTAAPPTPPLLGGCPGPGGTWPPDALPRKRPRQHHHDRDCGRNQRKGHNTFSSVATTIRTQIRFAPANQVAICSKDTFCLVKPERQKKKIQGNKLSSSLAAHMPISQPSTHQQHWPNLSKTIVAYFFHLLDCLPLVHFLERYVKYLYLQKIY